MTTEQRRASLPDHDLDTPVAPFVRRSETPAADDAVLLTYLRAARAHWVAFLAVVLVCTSAAWAWTSARPPSYEAAARVLVSPLPASDTTFIGVQVVRESSGDPTRSVQTAAALLDSGKAAEATAAALGDGRSAADVADAVVVEPVGGSNVLAVRAKAATAEDASATATSYARTALALRAAAVRAQIALALTALEEQRRASAESDAVALTSRIVQLRASQAQGDPSLSLEQEAGPGRLTGVPRSLVLALAVMAGAALGATAAILLELAGRRVRDTEEASALFPLPVLARVPRVLGRGRQLVVDGSLEPLDPAAHDAFQRVYRELAQEPRSGSAVLLTSASSGDGKTTAAVCLAVTMALAGRRVVLLDCDLRSARAAALLGVPQRDRGGAEPRADVDGLVVPVPGLSLSFLSFTGRTAAPASTEALIDRLPDVLAQLRPLADFVVIDTAPLGEVSDALPLLRVVDDVVVVTRPGHTDRSSFEAMRDLLRRMKAPVSGLLVVEGSGARGLPYPRRSAGGADGERAGTRRERASRAGGWDEPSSGQPEGPPRSPPVRPGSRPDVHRVRTGRGR